MTNRDKAPSRPLGAVVFAYHDIGVRCLETLLELGVEILLVITHRDNPAEEIWFSSVAELAHRNGIEVLIPDDPNSKAVVEKVSQCHPAFIFSFYYRHMLAKQLLEIPTQGAFNLHGSLLPAYRGRVPVNWAIIHGEKQTGVSLHKMEIKPDAGDLLAQQAVAILRNDTAFDVFQKLKCAAESLLLETVPGMLAGQLSGKPLELEKGSYFSGRKPQDGRIDWRSSASEIHNLIRAVAPPYPGAFFTSGSHHVELLGSYFQEEEAKFDRPGIYFENSYFHADCIDGRRFKITRLHIDGSETDEMSFKKFFGDRLVLETDNPA